MLPKMIHSHMDMVIMTMMYMMYMEVAMYHTFRMAVFFKNTSVDGAAPYSEKCFSKIKVCVGDSEFLSEMETGEVVSGIESET